MTWRNSILVGDVRERLADLPDGSVQCVVTSPPYWGLRDYGTASWDGGEEGHAHRGRDEHSGGPNPKQDSNVGARFASGDCLCGAKRVDSQVGLEPTPEAYVCGMVAVFREVRRVLADDGTLWLNLGDSYASAWSAGTRRSIVGNMVPPPKDGRGRMGIGLKEKDLVGIPWRVAFALQTDGWWLRSDIIWSKPNPMPESVTDRPTKAHEYVFLLSKRATYYYDHEAIKEPLSPVSIARISQPNFAKQTGGPKDYALTGEGIHSQRKTLENFAARVKTTSHEAETASMYEEGSSAHRLAKLRQSARAQGGEYGDESGRNKRSVWEIATKPYAEAHFATYPPELVKPCILAGSREGDVVLDPFMGSGTTALVALRAGRDFVGIELNPTYAEMAERRIAPFRDRLL